MRSHTRALAALTLREFKRWARQPSRVVTTLLTGGMFWLFLASGVAGDRFSLLLDAPGDPGAPMTYAAYLTPGIALMVVMFATVFAAIGLIQDRAEGFVRGALVSPAPVWVITGAKTIAGSTLAAAQGVAILGGALLVSDFATLGGIVLATAALTAAAVTTCAVGLALAWRMSSVAGFHGVMNLVLLPAWALSGALFPKETAAPWMSAVMQVNPAYWAHRAIAVPLQGTGETDATALAITLAVAAVSFVAAIATMRRGVPRIR